jgi:hypothetical protein
VTEQSARVVAVVAARDEIDRVAATVAALRGFVNRVVVADDGSSDGTGAAAAAAGAAVIRRARSAGKGDALEAALEVAGDADVILLADADLGATAASLVGLLGPVRAGSADIAVGVLPAAPGGGFGIVRRVSATLIRVAGGPRMEAPMSGQRALTAAALAAVRPLAPGFGVETAMGIDAARANLRVVEVPVAASHRARGRTVAGFTHRARQGAHLLRAAAPRLAHRRPRAGGAA